ncbi:MAG: DUF115 domain-containing protein [Simkaniaceae bacterium]|nr:DUF115 domain-containing protein [Simkaniaceae bacterium]
MSHFEENLRRFSNDHPLEALQITPSKNPLSLSKYENDSLDNLDVLFLQGVEKASAFSLLEIWPGKIILFESDMGKLGQFFTQYEVPARAKLLMPSPGNYLKCAWETLFLRTGGEISKELMEMLDSVHLIASDFADLGHKVLGNIEKNCAQIECDGQELFGAFQGVPAVICGAGPTLDRAIEKIKRLENRVLVIACGSALPLLTEKGCPVHLFAALDPDPPVSRFMRNTDHAVPVIYQNRLSHKILSLAHGRRLRMPGSGGYPADEWLCGEETFDAGWNAGAFGIRLAKAFGCTQIYTAGIDGGYIDGKRYAKGVDDGGGTRDLFLAKSDLAGTLPFLEGTFEKMWDIRGMIHRKSLKKVMIDQSKLERWHQSRLRCQEIVSEWIEKLKNGQTKWDAYYASNLEREAFFSHHISRVWEILRPVIERDMGNELECTLNRILFYQKVVYER